MYLSNLGKQKNYQSSAKRVGRGIGSGKGGHTVGRGMNGQMSRSGAKLPRKDFAGGQNPVSLRLPRRSGFKRSFAVKNTQIVKYSQISALNVTNITLESLYNAGLLKNKNMKDVMVKIVRDVEMDQLKSKLTVSENISYSKSLAEYISNN